jgi:hypothetical protein
LLQRCTPQAPSSGSAAAVRSLEQILLFVICTLPERADEGREGVNSVAVLGRPGNRYVETASAWPESCRLFCTQALL